MKFTSVFSMITAGITLASVNPVLGQTCPTVNCTNTISGGSITVDSGKVFCLSSGSWSGGVTLKKGGTIYVAPGATFNVSYTSGVFDGTLINCGTSSVALWGNANYTTIKNYGTFSSNGLLGFKGAIENHGTMSWSQLDAQEATFVNNGTMTIINTKFSNSTFNNSAVVNATGNFYQKNGGVLTNSATGSMNVGQNGNCEFAGEVDNLGAMTMFTPNAANGISKDIHNMGYMKITGQVTIGSSAYFTNDSLLEILPSNTINLAGALLQNNKRLYINGNIHLNNANSQIVNNGKMVVTGEIAQNVTNSKIVNNCNIVAYNYTVAPGTTINNGLIWATNKFKVESNSSSVVNDTNAFIRGTHFRNSGAISGFGSYYFTGTTDFNSAGTIIGTSSTLPIQFFDASQTGTNIFDTYVQNNPAQNTVRPSTMVPMDTTGYICGQSDDVAGFPPVAGRITSYLCTNGPLDINLSQYVDPHPPLVTRNFVIQTGSVKLYDYSDANNPTNNTNSLIIPNKGTLTFNPTTAILTFVPLASFTQGQFLAQYVISNTSNNDSIAYPSARTTISITVQPQTAAPTISVIGQ